MKMTEDRVRFSVQQLEKVFLEHWPEAIPYQAAEVSMPVNRVGHMLWMCKQILLFLQDGRREKALCWLGWVQGAVWAMGVLTIEEMKQDNKSEDSDL
jgi:hypothetical protein